MTGRVTNQSLDRSLGHLEGKIDLVLARIDALDKREDAQDAAISSIRSRQNYFAGAIGTLIFALTFFGDEIKAAFTSN